RGGAAGVLRRPVGDPCRRRAGAAGAGGARMRIWLLAAVFLGACHAAAPEPKGRFPTPLVAQAPDEDAVVATVDGRPIRASQVAEQARAAGQSAREALQALVDAEVLAGEAARRGLDGDPDVQEAAEAAAVRRLLHTGFESEV